MRGVLADLTTPDQAEVLDLVRSVAPLLPEPSPEEDASGQCATRGRGRSVLVESGLWTIGVDDAIGGGGAGADLRQVALAALGGQSAALAWAIVQVDAAAQLLAAADGAAPELEAVLAGELAVVVVDLADPRVDLEVDDDDVRGTIGRIDTDGDATAVVVLGRDDAWFVRPDAVTTGPALPTTGLSGTRTVSAVLHAGGPSVVHVPGVAAEAVRARMLLGGAAIAAGLAAEAADRAAAYAAERDQFGAPLTALPTIRATLASQHARARTAVAACLPASADTADAASGPAGMSGREYAAAVLRRNCDDAVSVTADALMVHGGYGYLHEYGIERLVRDAVSLRAATGAHAAARRAADRFAPS